MRKEEWISVKDNMPVVDKEVRVRDIYGDIYTTYLHLDGRWGCDDCGIRIKDVIAWQPILEI